MGVIKIPTGGNNERIEKVKQKLAQKGYGGSLLLGVLFALAFCPYSGALFFGAVIPLVLASPEGLLLPPVFALGTGLPVIVFSFLIAFSMKKVSRAFQAVQKVEKIVRYIVASIFIVVGIYYLQYIVMYFSQL